MPKNLALTASFILVFISAALLGLFFVHSPFTGQPSFDEQQYYEAVMQLDTAAAEYAKAKEQLITLMNENSYLLGHSTIDTMQSNLDTIDQAVI